MEQPQVDYGIDIITINNIETAVPPVATQQSSTLLTPFNATTKVSKIRASTSSLNSDLSPDQSPITMRHTLSQTTSVRHEREIAGLKREVQAQPWMTADDDSRNVLPLNHQSRTVKMQLNRAPVKKARIDEGQTLAEFQDWSTKFTENLKRLLKNSYFLCG